MTTISEAFFNALLADAAYVPDLVAGMTGDSLALAIKVRMTPTCVPCMARIQSGASPDTRPM